MKFFVSKKFDMKNIFDMTTLDIEPGVFADWHKLKAKLLSKKAIV